jgi:hypothetical protein
VEEAGDGDAVSERVKKEGAGKDCDDPDVEVDEQGTVHAPVIGDAWTLRPLSLASTASRRA